MDAIKHGNIKFVKQICLRIINESEIVSPTRGWIFDRLFDFTSLKNFASKLGFNKVVQFLTKLSFAGQLGQWRHIKNICKADESGHIKKERIDSKMWELIELNEKCNHFLRYLGAKPATMEYSKQKLEKNESLQIKNTNTKNKNETSHNQNEELTLLNKASKHWWRDSVIEAELNCGVTNESKSIEMMNNICLAVCKLLENKLPLDDQMLVLCYRYSFIISKFAANNDTSNISEETKQLYNKFVALLQKTARDCVINNANKSNSSSEELQESEGRKRSYLWFKRYLLHSNVWFQSCPEKDGILFDLVSKMAKEELINQQKFIKDFVLMEEKLDSENLEKIGENGQYWKKLISLKDWQSKEIKELRQDSLAKVCKSQFNKNELFVSDDSGFDATETYDLTAYVELLMVNFRNKWNWNLAQSIIQHL